MSVYPRKNAKILQRLIYCEIRNAPFRGVRRKWRSAADDVNHAETARKDNTMESTKKAAATAAKETAAKAEAANAEALETSESMEVDFGVSEEDGMELAVNSDRFERMNLQRDICGGGKGFCSMVAVDTKAKKTLFNATSNPAKISSMIGKTIDLLHFYVEVIQVVSEQTGEIVNVPRVVLIDVKGNGYQGVSIGLYNALKRIVSMFGMPETWDEPLTVEVQQIEVKNGRTFNLLMV